MRTYKIAFLYSKNGASWTRTTKHVKADSDTAAIMQINSMYPFIKDVRILSVR